MTEPKGPSNDREIGGLTAVEWSMVAAALVDDLGSAIALLRESGAVDAAAIDALHARLTLAAKNATFEGHPMAREKRVTDVSCALLDMAFGRTQDSAATADE